MYCYFLIFDFVLTWTSCWTPWAPPLWLLSCFCEGIKCVYQYLDIHKCGTALHKLSWAVSVCACVIPGLYLLLQVVLHPHAQLVQLIPLLRQAYRAVLRVLVVQDQGLLHGRTQILNLLQLAAHSTDLLVLTLLYTHTNTRVSRRNENENVLILNLIILFAHILFYIKTSLMTTLTFVASSWDSRVPDSSTIQDLPKYTR